MHAPPVISFILFTYNQESFVEEAIEGAFNQTYSPLEIIISDDASTDDSFEKIKILVDEYQGAHLVRAQRNMKNMGINAHMNALVEQAAGDFIVVAAGDDVSLPTRVEEQVRRWQAGSSAVFSNAELIDANSLSKGGFVRKNYKHMETWREMVVLGTHGVWGCTLSWEKKVFDTFGPMPTNILGEDAVVPFRSALMGGVGYVDEELVLYRDHGENVSFWVREKGLTQKQLIRMGIKTLRFKVRMCLNWKLDLKKAESKGLITSEDLSWGLAVLTENIMLFDKTKSFLAMPLWKLFVLLPIIFMYLSWRMSRKIPFFKALKQTVWKLLNGILHYRFPIFHQKIRSLFGRNT
ncbi:MAG: glycosyltransferase [Mariprofundaceae bacterium]|nr:glycosyltransferase [Mariprofundaceae bacterium]